MIHAYLTSATRERLVLTFRQRQSDQELGYAGSRRLSTGPMFRNVVRTYRAVCPEGHCRVFMRTQDSRSFRLKIWSKVIPWLEREFGATGVEVVEDNGCIYGMGSRQQPLIG
jgi:hypothetical protein